jgi:SHS family lactate transporter-like MFS transporter
VQGLFGGAIYGQNPSYLSERFPTEVRATAAGFCYHQGAIFGGLVAPVLTYLAVNYDIGFGVAMMFGTTIGLISFIIAVFLGPETKGHVFESDVVVT